MADTLLSVRTAYDDVLLAAEQIAYVAGNCDARIAVLDGASELARWQPVLSELPGLKKIIVIDAGACPAGDMYLSWQDFAALGAIRLAESAAEVPVGAVIAQIGGGGGDPVGEDREHERVSVGGVAVADEV